MFQLMFTYLFLAALQPYKSSCPCCKKMFQLFSFLIKTKVVQNVNRMTGRPERHADRQSDRQTDGQTDRKTDRKTDGKTGR